MAALLPAARNCSVGMLLRLAASSLRGSVLRPRRFHSLGITHPTLLAGLARCGAKEPSEIQEKVQALSAHR